MASPFARKPPRTDPDESRLKISKPKDSAAGVTAVGVSMKRSIDQMGVRRTARALRRVNQHDGFDCQSCAWPDPHPEHRRSVEFCENGAKAVAEEATLRQVGAEFFATHSVDDLADHTDYWLGQQGRLTQPMVKPAGSRHYQPIEWDEA